MWAPIILGIVLGWLLYLWDVSRKHYSYWASRGVPHPRALPFLGNTDPIWRPLSNLYSHLYKSYPDEPYVGFFELTKKHLLIRSPELVHQVLIKDFGSFMDRNVGLDEGISEVDSTLFTLRGSKWRAIRNKLTPTFTTGKIKLMVPQMIECSSNLAHYLDANSSLDVETRDLMFAFSTDVIGTTAFGLDVGSMREGESEFRTMARKSLNFGPLRFIGLLALTCFPSLSKLLRITFTPSDVAAFFSKVIKDTMADRRQRGVERNDFVQLLLQLKDKGQVEWTHHDPEDKYLEQQLPKTTESFELTDKILTSQAFSFISAGSEPVANTLTFALIELAANPDVQEKAREEVDRAIAHRGGFNYESLKDMVYLEHVINETLRKWPLVRQLLRLCTKDIKLPDSNLLVEEGTMIAISTSALHHDPKIYDRPSEFLPERFEDPPPKGTYLPFGDGPRMCIAMRFAIIEIKVGLASILHRYKVIPSPKTKQIVLNRWSFFSVPNHDVFLTYMKIHPQDCTMCSLPST